MGENDIRREIESELSKRSKQVVNKNAIDAMFLAFPGPIQGLKKALFGRREAIDAEKQRITINAILQLLLKIDRAISDNNGDTYGIDWKVVGGDIEAYGENASEVTGMIISNDAGPVEFNPGTHIKASGKNVGRITGLRIGGKLSDDDEDN